MRFYSMDHTRCRMQPIGAAPQIPHPASRFRSPIHVNPLNLVVRAFVNTFGITQPTPETEAKAGRFIVLMLIAVLLLIGVIAWLLRDAFTR